MVHYDLILSMFTANGISRPQLNSPCRRNGAVLASDSYALIMVPEGDVIGKYENEAFPKNAETLITNHIQHAEFEIKAHSLLDLVNHCKIKFEKIDCEKCDGTGEIMCICCEQTSECKDCDGTGQSDELKPFPEFSFENDRITLGKHTYSPFNLFRVACAALFSGEKEIIFSQPANSQGTVCKLANGIQILVLPLIK